MSKAGTMKKRQRKTTAVASCGIDEDVDSLPVETLRHILANAAKLHKDVAIHIYYEIKKIIAAEKANKGNFDPLVDCILNALDADCSYVGLFSETSEKAWAVATDVKDCIEAIARASQLREAALVSSIREKETVLQKLIIIGRTISFSCGSSLGGGVIALFKYHSCLEYAMLRTVQSMKGKDRNSIEIEKYADQLIELRYLGLEFGIFRNSKEPCLADVYFALLELASSSIGGLGNDLPVAKAPPKRRLEDFF